MVRIIPHRLKSHNGPGSGPGTGPNSRSSSPGPAMTTQQSNRRSPSPGLNGLVLRIVVLRARNLAAKDKNGTSDPFLVLSLGDARDTTQYVPKTLNPEWNHKCELPITGIHSLLLDCVCWDKDRFGKDYLGEFELALEDIFANDKTEQPAQWFPLMNKRSASKKSIIVSGEVQLQFTMYDSSKTASTPQQVMEKFWAIAGVDPETIATHALTKVQSASSAHLRRNLDDEDVEYLDEEEEPSDETDDPSKPEVVEKKKRKMRIKGLKKLKAHQLYEFNSESEVSGILYLEIVKVTDLPPEKNLTRTSFDMDPFVVASLGRKTYRTRVIRHKLNPVFNEKMLFQVLRHEQAYSLAFTVMDLDKLSGNDFIASASIQIQDIMNTASKPDPETGLYEVREPREASLQPKKSRFKISLSRSSSSQSLSKMSSKPTLPQKNGGLTGVTSDPHGQTPPPPTSTPATGLPGEPLASPNIGEHTEASFDEKGDPEFHTFNIPLKLKNLERWEEKHKPELLVRAKYAPYPALRQQFWRSMLRQYDTDESGLISKIELTTMLDTLGSTLKESTIDSFFQRFPHHRYNGDDDWELTFDEAVICLEDQLQVKSWSHSMADKVKHRLPSGGPGTSGQEVTSAPSTVTSDSSSTAHLSFSSHHQHHSFSNLIHPQGHHSFSTLIHPSTSSLAPAPSASDDRTPSPGEMESAIEEGDYLDPDDLNDQSEERVVQIRECPICHQPRMNRRSDTDIIAHIATCASQDWRQVNSIVMAGFVTASQAQRKWYSKVITKISYGGYKLGANSANILVQDRLTGQINEERMSIYVRLGIRLLYKGLKSREMEKKRIRKLLRSLSIKQGVKFDDPASKNEIQKFISFHQLDMTEVLRPLDEFKNFNEFFYRELKPNARPCSAPDDTRIIVSPADCRSVVFNEINDATAIWIKGREFSISRLLGNTYPEDAKRYVGGALGIFRLAPQDYHRFHIPVDGVMDTPKLIEGEYYTVNPMAIRSALDVYGENIRTVVPINSVSHGRVMVICVGAMMVGSTVITRKAGDHVKRAEELGYFKFGGSTIIVLFEPDSMRFDEDLISNSSGALETLLRVGMSIGHHPHQHQYTPDMRKPEAEVSELDRADARRRIQGSIAPGLDDENGAKALAALAERMGKVPDQAHVGARRGGWTAEDVTESDSVDTSEQ